uniref:Serine protease K12H4.7 n=1 Tax=Lygus hesperus TaxID=30085 RepID=A0A0K8SDX0_LYGHE
MHFLRTALVVAVAISSGSTKFTFLAGDKYDENVAKPMEWFDSQKLDHFDPTNLSTWKQRYIVENQFFTNLSGPVFLYIGGEGALPWFPDAAMTLYALQYGALMFGLEHRYYGDSRPRPDLTVESLRYLSSEQALADIAYFIEHINSKYRLTPQNKWVVFGGSYAGNLAAWARLKYPHLIHAAVSSSGPVLAKAAVDFGEFFQHVAVQHSKECADNIHRAALEVATLLNQTGGPKVLTEKFNLCHPLDMKTMDDTSVFVDSIIRVLWVSLQGGGAAGLESICDTMNEGSQDILVRYALATRFSRSSCNNIPSFNESIELFKDTSYYNGMGRPWFYQTCTEFGFYTTASSRRGFFGSDLFLSYYVDQCKQVFGEQFNLKKLSDGIKRTNSLYGGLNMQVTNVVFVQGSLDPWSELGIRTSKPGAPAIVIDGTTHCQDMYPPSDSDPQSLKDARKEISNLIGKWISMS